MQVEVESRCGKQDACAICTNVPLVIKNRELSLYGWIEKEMNEEIYDEIVDVVKRSGWRGIRAYFYCKVEKTDSNNLANVVKINVSRVLPVEIW